MNEFAAKKLGEVLAFCNAGLVIFEKGGTALQSVLHDEFGATNLAFSSQAQEINRIATSLGSEDITKLKAEKTTEKLLSMAEMYIGEEWDNSAELLEWLGFFEGAAIVHWRLVVGVASKVNNLEFSKLASDGVSLHTNLLDKVGREIEKYAISKV